MSGDPWQATLGAIPTQDGVTFRVWAPTPRDVELVLFDPSGERTIPTEGQDGYRVAYVPGAGHGQRYAYWVDGAGPFPDPCSRRQPEGAHAPSEVVDPSRFRWEHGDFRPPAPRDVVIYEAHIGTLTPDGTFASAACELERLARLGVNAIEVMPIASFPGRWNWGYDGAALFAPHEGYGGPAGFQRFVDEAHGHGLAVILDVVFNHFGPDGNYTGVYSDRYLTNRHSTPWGDAVNFDDEGSDDVRRFVIENVLHWRHEYHVDGFRFDATHAIVDTSLRHILADVRSALDAHPLGPTPAILIAESHENEARYVEPFDEGGFGFDAVWADDFHHAARTFLRPEHEGYLAPYQGTARDLALTVEQGFLFEGQIDLSTGKRRGTRARHVPWSSFVYCLQNHDQVGNRAFGDRLATTVGRDRQLALTTLLLLLPQVPLLFQGQEWCTTTPFQYFTDHNPELGRRVTEGRRQEFAAFRAFRDERLREMIPDPQDEATFLRSRLDSSELSRGLGGLAEAFHRELLSLRRTDPVLVRSREGRKPLLAVAEGHHLWVRIENEAGSRLIAINAGPERLTLEAPSPGRCVLTSTDVRWGGSGAMPFCEGTTILLPPDCGALFSLEP